MVIWLPRFATYRASYKFNPEKDWKVAERRGRSEDELDDGLFDRDGEGVRGLGGGLLWFFPVRGCVPNDEMDAFFASFSKMSFR